MAKPVFLTKISDGHRPHCLPKRNKKIEKNIGLKTTTHSGCRETSKALTRTQHPKASSPRVRCSDDMSTYSLTIQKSRSRSRRAAKRAKRAQTVARTGQEYDAKTIFTQYGISRGCQRDFSSSKCERHYNVNVMCVMLFFFSVVVGIKSLVFIA